MLWGLIALVVVVVVSLAGSLAWQVEDWSRDLSTHVAETSPDHPHPDQRPLETRLDLDRTLDAVSAAADGLRGWSRGETTRQADRAEVRLVRTTPLFRFRDDITVSLQAVAQGTRVTMHSKSRVGKGDLGQNPRNIRELVKALRPLVDG